MLDLFCSFSVLLAFCVLHVLAQFRVCKGMGEGVVAERLYRTRIIAFLNDCFMFNECAKILKT
jgi:hypothetical protein